MTVNRIADDQEAAFANTFFLCVASQALRVTFGTDHHRSRLYKKTKLSIIGSRCPDIRKPQFQTILRVVERAFEGQEQVVLGEALP